MRRLQLVVLAIGLALSGCGGGGGGGSDGGGGSGGGGAPVTFSPSTVTASGVQSVVHNIYLTATLNTSIVNGTVHIAVIDDVGVVDPDWTITPTSNTSASILFKTLPTLSVGTHTGNLKVYLCRDINCTSQHPGSPVLLPYSIVVTQAPPAARLVPTSIEESQEVGALEPILITATHGSLVQGTVYYRVTDPNNVFSPNVTPSYSHARSSTIQLNVNPAQIQGSYSGTLQLNLCKDFSCNTPYPGSPIEVPYAITLTAPTNITPLRALTGAGDWETYQGKASHNAYLPVTLDPAQFSKRWSWAPGTTPLSLGFPATTNGMLYFTNSSTKTLHALHEHDAAPAWQKNFGSIFAVSPPATANGKVFVTTAGHSDTFMWGLSAVDGAQSFQTAFSAQWPFYPSPTVYAGTIYNAGGYFGGMNAFNASTGASSFAISLAQEDSWTPAVDATNAYSFLHGKFQVFDRLTGSVLQSFSASTSTIETGTPVIGAPGAILARRQFGNWLYNFNPSTSALNWSVSGPTFLSDPVVANGVVYITTSSPSQRLEARSLSTGELQWSWHPPGGQSMGNDNIIVANNLIFVSTPFYTYAIDINTRAAVWSHKLGGKLAVSTNGILYIVNGSSTGKITAINLH